MGRLEVLIGSLRVLIGCVPAIVMVTVFNTSPGSCIRGGHEEVLK